MPTDAISLDERAQWAAIHRLVHQIAARERQMQQKRRHDRFAFNLPVAISEIDDAGDLVHYCDAWAFDISHSGIGLMTTQRVNCRELVYINFEPAIRRPCHLPMKLMRSSQLIEGIYQTGLQFPVDAEGNANL